ncbi:hypothetical protein [Clostridium butyricum]|nr:hypothetical protein [Clostridium butyricum]
MNSLTFVNEKESMDMIISIFKKVEPTKEEILLMLGSAYMAGLEKGKEVS